ncbi:hypothetical protein [Nocardioides bizhenqiangii]|uniref:Limonene hydroxylase n=1 Tax=Nocardioides bizhenqiangii TaxID=3095076 RepID=A0ABZ0ZM84_9ACTN|nr:hypothetical protein [Nocardioides sp. HM61]WQQ25308.1 hypothetical protein SHK19_15215 [Nocardioides sp. HM61]
MTEGESIYEFLRDHLDEAGRLSDPDLRLPDEKTDTSGLRWAPGAMDGVLGHHAGSADSDQAQAVADAIVKASRRPTKRRLRDLYRAVDTDGVLEYVDAAIELVAQAGADPTRVHDVGRWLATTGSNRSAVKVGIALIGVSGLDRDVDVVRVLGAHEEFTLFAAVALKNGLDDPDSELWALAAAVDGWGRIHCVEQLRDTDDPAIRSWILREGFRNSVMYEYLAHIAATTGDLLSALRAEAPDRELLTAAGEIIEALVQGGPAQDLEDYTEGADAVEAYLSHMATRAETLGDFHAVDAIRSFLDRDGSWDELSQQGWTATRRAAFEDLCAQILDRDVWNDLIAVALLSDDGGEFWRADQAARRRGIDTYDIHLRRVREDPLGHGWFAAWQQADAVRAQALATLARALLPLDQIASGPADELGLGQEWRANSALDWSLQALRDHPGVGAELIVAGLQSPVTRNRNMALQALKEWPAARWPDRARDLVTALADHDPNPQTRELAGEVCGVRPG